MDSEKFIQKCKQLVADYANENFDKTDQMKITTDNVFVVWSCKTLQNNKALLSTTVSDGMYYELTYNGEMGKQSDQSLANARLFYIKEDYSCEKLLVCIFNKQISSSKK